MGAFRCQTQNLTGAEKTGDLTAPIGQQLVKLESATDHLVNANGLVALGEEGFAGRQLLQGADRHDAARSLASEAPANGQPSNVDLRRDSRGDCGVHILLPASADRDRSVATGFKIAVSPLDARPRLFWYR